jgi:MinD-like ATPase involved in chromosome partitioning or flagellar assembly
MTIRFDDAWARALDIARQAAVATHLDVVLIRDILGRVSLLIDDSAGQQVAEGAVSDLAGKLADQAGPFAGPTGVTLASEFFIPDQVLRARDLVVVEAASDASGQVSVLERGVVGAEWLHPRPYSADAPVRRVALYGFKGGVGRSTATFMLAQHLANQGSGRCVLAVDLDLESPGLGALLQADDELPDYGLVDYFAESAVGNAGGLDLVTRSGIVRASGNGEVWVAPAGGRPRDDYDYLAKLNRVYAELPREDVTAEPAGPSGLAWRLEAAIVACEDRVAELSRRPDVILLDSRAGIHDIAAIAITQLADLSLLFGTDSTSSWGGYRALFRQWRQPAERAQAIRERLRMVAAMVPRERREEYLEEFRDHAQACFAATLYDDVPSDSVSAEDVELYNPGPDDEEAPHSPLPILFVPELIGMNLSMRSGWPDIDPGAYAPFLEGATVLIFGDEP